MPFQKIGPLGSFIQFFAGSKWHCGRRGSAAKRDCSSSFSKKETALKSCESGMPARGTAHSFCKKPRRDVGICWSRYLNAGEPALGMTIIQGFAYCAFA